MAAAAGLAVTVIPVLMGYFIRGRIPEEQRNPLNRALIAGYRPLLEVGVALSQGHAAASRSRWCSSRRWPLSRDSAVSSCRRWMKAICCTCRPRCPDCRRARSLQLLQQTDRLIKTVPEVATVFGKAGRAETATDPAPLEMFETMIQFKPRDQWRAGMTTDKLIEEMDRLRARAGADQYLDTADSQSHRHAGDGNQESRGRQNRRHRFAESSIASAHRSKRSSSACPASLRRCRNGLSGGRYIDVKIDREAASRYGLNISDVQSVVATAIGGMTIGESVEGLQRFPISVRYPREIRDSLDEAASAAGRDCSRERRSSSMMWPT